MDDNYLERIYKERLEEDIITLLSENESIPLERAMDIYYSSNLSYKIAEGSYGIQYLDYKVLLQILYDTEPELLKSLQS